jgi:NADH-quinone oxidoreductase subunit N
VTPLLHDILLAALALAIFAADLALPERHKRIVGWLTCIGLAAIFGASFAVDSLGESFGGAFVADGPALWFKRALLAAGAISALMAIDPVERQFARHQGEYWLLLVLSLLGMSLVASARELMFFVVSFELMSIPLFVLAAFAKGERSGSEAALKFYLIGVASFAITLYGLSLVYGATGTTMLPEIARRAEQAPSMLLVAGMLTTLAGLAFKIGAVPFHMWMPDTYAGAATPYVGFLSVAPKIAGLAAILRLYLEGFAPLAARFMPVVIAVCALNMVIGNLLALPQRNVKRLLAYSGIAQIGYMLLGVIAMSNEGVAMLLFYLAAYLFTNLGAFAVVSVVERATGSVDIDAWRGLSRRSPALALAMLIFLLSLGGIPFVAGFWAKLGVFIAAWHAGGTALFVLVVLGAVLAVVGVFYYLRVARSIYLEDPQPGSPAVRVPRAQGFAIGVCAVAVVLIGVFPRVLIDGAQVVAQAWRP